MYLNSELNDLQGASSIDYHLYYGKISESFIIL